MITYTITPGQEAHPLVAGLPSEFTFEADGHMGGPQVEFGSEPSTVIMQLPSGTPGVLVRNLGLGKVINFSFAPNYSLAGEGHTLQDGNVRQLYVNAVQWALNGSTPTPTKAPATITLTDPGATFDGTVKGVLVTTAPAGLTGLTVTYSQDGFPVSAPVNAGVYQVVASLDHPDYAAPQATGTMAIGQATPVIQWTPATVTAGTALGPAQLNAAASGVNGGGLAGEFFYLPGAGTVLSAGTHPVSVEFQPMSDNYKNAIKTVTITVLPVVAPPKLKFAGFFQPVYNMPVINTVAAGRAVPVRFMVEGARGSQVLLAGSPTSVPTVCSSRARTEKVKQTGLEPTSHLQKWGDLYTYVWVTSPSWAGNCRKLIVTLVDGSKHEAVFRFGKAEKQKASRPAKSSRNKFSGNKDRDDD
jgi:hypothetical protein